MDTTKDNALREQGVGKTTPLHFTKKQQNFKSYFDRARLPNPAEYFASQGLKLTGGGEWRNAICPFHDDTNPSLRVRLDTGGFRCMVCGAHGGDVLAFHQQRYSLNFKQAAMQLGAWVGGAR